MRGLRQFSCRYGGPLPGDRSEGRFDVDDDQRPRGHDARVVCGRRRTAGGADRGSPRDNSGRHTEGVYRPEGMDLSPPSLDAHHHRHDRVLHERNAPVESDFCQRLSHPRGRIHGRPGTGLHPRRRVRLRRGRRRTGHGCGLVRPPPFVLFQFPSRFLRRDRQVPRGTTDLGEADEEQLWRKGSPIPCAQVSHADRRMHAHRTTTGEQHREDRLSGTRRRPGRHSVAPHQLDG